MQKFDSNLIVLIFVELAVVYLLASMLAADCWVIYRLFTGKPVLPRSPLVAPRPSRWGAWTVLLIIVMTLVLPNAVVLGYAAANGLLPGRSQARPRPASAPDPSAKPGVLQQSPQGPARVGKSSPPDAFPAPANVLPVENPTQAILELKDQTADPRNAVASKSEPKLSLTENLAIQAASSVILLALATLVLRMTSPSPLRDIGLSFEKWWLQAAVGVIAFLAIEPLLLAIQFGSVWLWETNEVHPLFKMVRDELSPGVPQLAILLAVIIAPLCEEVLFRGIIQTWVVSRFNRLGLESAPAPAESSAIAEFQALPEVSLSHAQAEAPEAATDQCRNSVGTPSEPPPDAPSTPLGRRPSSLAAIITISLIFAALHWPQWPAPISIFVLSVTIGYVYQRTGSLIAAVCMHAMFNGLSTLVLIGSLFFPQSAQHPDAKTAKPHAAIATFSAPRDCACIHCKK